MSHETVINAADAAAVTNLRGVGPRVAEKLARLGIHTIEDLLLHLPYRYQDRTRVAPMGSLREGDEVVIQGKVLLAQVRYGRRRSLLVRIADGTGTVTLRFFHFSKTQESGFARGILVRCFGEVRRGPQTLELVHPEYRVMREDDSPPVEEHLTPLYPATEGLQQNTFRNLIEQAMAEIAQVCGMQELLPDDVLDQFGFPALEQALRFVHYPPPELPLAQLSEGRHPAQQRLAFEELLAHHLSLRQLRHKARRHRAPVLDAAGELAGRFFDALPFELTGAQQRVIGEIRSDIGQGHPMMRLVQGDVGSGKTVVAAAAALAAVESGWQAAIMAPTELLAEQHYRNFYAWLEPLGLNVAWLSGKAKGKAREAVLEEITSGHAQVVAGTHALFQDDVGFPRLGLVVIDEQHRFGVHQRMALREKGRRNGYYPHQLIMTATPIPRTLAMTAYGDLDVSVIDELPKGRTPVETVVVPDHRRAQVVERVRLACREGRQAYWVCPLIEESEALQCQAAQETASVLSEALPEVRVGLVHGRLKAAEKEQIMAAFKAGELDLLVATTVIEVGVDVPNASLMIIENAERLGLAQLHQLRGRVGRGAVKSSCVLMYHGPLSRHGQARLATMRETNDGFEIARKDLELRGPGEVLGTRQTGMLQFRIADLQRDQHLVPLVASVADGLLSEYPERVPGLTRRWLRQGVRYGDV